MKEIKQLEKAMVRVENIKTLIKKAIMNLPENKDIIQLSDQPRCFTVKANSLNERWNPHYHSFRLQYQAITRLIDKTRPESIVTALKKVIETKRIRSNMGTVPIHPTVAGYLKQLI